ncbi:ABC transporter permease [Brucella intermedia]
MSPKTVSTSAKRHAIPLALTGVSLLVYVGVALATGQYAQVTFAGITGLLERMVALGLVAIGQAVVISSGAIDLSVANLVSVCAVLAGYFMQNEPANITHAILIVVLVAAAVGALNGILISYLNVNPLIATLGISLALQGMLGVSYSSLQGAVPRSFQQFAYGSLSGYSFSVMAMFAIAFLTAIALNHTRLGSSLYAVGGNQQAAWLAGIRNRRVTILVFSFSGVMCAIAGLYLASRLGVGTPWIGRDGNYDLDSIAAVVIGGTLLAGGRGSIVGTLAGVFVFATTDAVFNMLQIDPFLSQVFRGLIVVAAVGCYTFRNKGETA